mmetsp:Transcript_28295/g.24996  ORF Transcript_28295/g.24996 Transcript_28295/m.24996 type:complete len:134 (-) Transcript_28295:104-505(-)|eukprot:CAMPEP_0201571416 /NCGR_PEP_ID=MMETSP0190_2-20130828/14180_1 /ASSEMBLY_ACC=CAM_ASM_000263 /TAXON_ID=37353 /ORGANISM="Rosalina sp." /LENGTH=133 /DNA_ID=CAMNT_0047996041 /DNA_START=32 /DNA_END=433 /DNA_ORIENTATION=-
METATYWVCDNCIYEYNRYPSNACAICGTERPIEDNVANTKEIGNMIITGYLAKSGKAACVSTVINDFQARKDLEESHIQTIILTYGYVREWENEQENQKHHVPPGITRMIADWAKKEEEKKHIGDLVSSFLM